MKEGLSYGDVLLIPKRGVVKSRRDVDTTTRVTKNVVLKSPLVSANMDTVTGEEMAIAMAKHGGLGVVHQFMSIEDQAEVIRRVKRATSFIIEEPFSIDENEPVGKVLDNGSHGWLVTKNGKLSGILSKRDFRLHEDHSTPIKDLMSTNLITAKPGISFEKAKELLKKNRIEKLPLVDKEMNIKGLITLKDILHTGQYPDASRDEQGRYLVAGAVGVKAGFLERAEALIKAGADLICVDIAHGHSDLAINTVSEIKKKFPKIDVLAGNIATAEGAKDLIKAGADGLKVGVGPGAACSTRIIAGSGVPQLTAILDVAKVARAKGIPVCADGGIKAGGDISKAIIAGADTVMIGSVLAATDESPGRIIFKDGKRYKIYRGSASTAANLARVKREKRDFDDRFTAEGVDTLLPYKGTMHEVFSRLMGGLCSGLSYCGARSLEEARKKGEFIKITSAGYMESKPRFKNDEGYV